MSTKTFTVVCTHYRTFGSNSISKQTGTLAELIKYSAYTLATGASYAHEKGNKQINENPKTIKSLISNLNNAVNNAAQNGCSSRSYTLEETVTA
jgi:hypothetical protein